MGQFAVCYRGSHRRRSAARDRVALAAAAASVATVGGAHVAGAEHNPSATDGSRQVRFLAQRADAAETAAAPLVMRVQGLRPAGDLAAQLATALQYNADRAARDLAARLPTVVKPAEGLLTSPFGPRWGTFHKGIDIANVTGTDILAVMDGTVIDAGPAQGFGQWIRVLHDDGMISVYGHVDTIECAVGDRVTAGQRIAGMGNRGFSTGTHLHFEVHPDGGEAVDPAQWLADRGIEV